MAARRSRKRGRAGSWSSKKRGRAGSWSARKKRGRASWSSRKRGPWMSHAKRGRAGSWSTSGGRTMRKSKLRSSKPSVHKRGNWKN